MLDDEREVGGEERALGANESALSLLSHKEEVIVVLQARRAGIAAAVLLLLALGVAVAQGVDVASIKQEADRIAQEFRIGARPSQLTAEHVDSLLAKLPGFGERTVQTLKANAPYRRLSELAQLERPTDSGPRRLLSEKQLLLIAIFFDLDP